MQHLMIGIAGHIDHGKTALVKSLTGVDTDRLAEEKRRKITIDLGFAQLRLSDQQQAALIDLPGHMDYMKNMMAGASGIDLAVMVVAADEGIMPQTLEHLAILSQFGVKHGVIVLTKCDLVERAQLDFLHTAIRTPFAESFLSDAPIIESSAVTNQGIAELQNCLAEQAKKLQPRSITAPFWMPIDRVFTITGFGTVVTGGVLSGRLRVGDHIRLLPEQTSVRVRGLQHGGQTVDVVFAGQRAAVNLAGIKTKEISRGMVLTDAKAARGYTHLDVKLSVFPDAPYPVTHAMQMHLSLGTSSQVCRICLLDCKQIQPGGSGFAQLRLQKPIPARLEDRFVLRFFSPMHLAGGGVILALDPPRHRKLDKQVLERLHLYAQGTVAQKLLLKTADQPKTIDQLGEVFWHLSTAELQSICADLLQQGLLQRWENCFFATDSTLFWQKQLLTKLAAWQESNPFAEGMPLSLFDEPSASFMVQFLAKQDVILYKDGVIIQKGKEPVENAPYQRSKQLLESYCKPLGFRSITKEQALGALQLPSQQAKQALQRLLRDQFLIELPNQTYLLQQVGKQAWQQTEQELSIAGTITLARLRDLLQISRKYAQPLLEWFDLMGWTRRIDDYRVLNQD